MHEGTRQRHTLLFTAGKLHGAMTCASAQTDKFQRFEGTVCTLAARNTEQAQRYFDIFLRRQCREEMGVLEKNANAFAAQSGTRGFVHLRQVLPQDAYPAEGGVIQPDQDVQQGRLA